MGAVPQGDAVAWAGAQEPHPRLLQLGVEVSRPAPGDAVVVGMGDLQVAGRDGQETLSRVRPRGELEVPGRLAVTEHGAVVLDPELGCLPVDRRDCTILLDDVASVVEVPQEPSSLLVESGGRPAVGLPDSTGEVIDEDVNPPRVRVLDHAGVDHR